MGFWDSLQNIFEHSPSHMFLTSVSAGASLIIVVLITVEVVYDLVKD